MRKLGVDEWLVKIVQFVHPMLAWKMDVKLNMMMMMSLRMQMLEVESGLMILSVKNSV